MKAVKAFGQFWYEFLIGDDWKIAAAVAVALMVSGVLVVHRTFGDGALAVIGAVLVALGFSVSMLLDVRRAD